MRFSRPLLIYSGQMLPGERITTIKRVAAALAEEPWADLNLTLRQFGFPTDQDGDFLPPPYEYVMGCLEEKASDPDLLALQDHVFPGVGAGPRAEDSSGGPWTEGSFRLFVSHTHSHQAFAGSLREALLRWGVDAFVAHDRIEPSQEWQAEIESALNTCDALTAVLTKDFVESRWCDQEVGFCIARGILIVPLSLYIDPDGYVDPHGFIGKYQRMNAIESEEPLPVAGRLFDLLAAHDLTADKMTHQVALRYAASFSFDNARENFERLVTIPKEHWNEEMAEIVEGAAARNSQIQYARTRIGESMPEAATRHVDEMLDRDQASSDDIPFLPDDDIPF
jgi:hypothetical protein